MISWLRLHHCITSMWVKTRTLRLEKALVSRQPHHWQQQHTQPFEWHFQCTQWWWWIWWIPGCGDSEQGKQNLHLPSPSPVDLLDLLDFALVSWCVSVGVHVHVYMHTCFSYLLIVTYIHKQMSPNTIKAVCIYNSYLAINTLFQAGQSVGKLVRETWGGKGQLW